MIYAAAVFDPGDWVEVRTISSADRDDVRSDWIQAGSLPALARRLAKLNATGAHIYVGANPRPREGVRGDDSIELARCVFIDFDGIGVDEARMRIESVGLPAPTLLLSSGRGVHAYWRLVVPMANLAEWTRAQKRMIAALGGDRCIHNAERIMRLPGFVNHKPPAAPAAIVDCDATRRHDLAHLLDILPPPPRPIARPTGEIPQYTKGDPRRWLDKALALIGDGRSNRAHFLACQMRDNRVPVGTAEALMREFVTRCPAGDHPYTEREAMGTLASVMRSSPRAPAATYGLAKLGALATADFAKGVA